MHLSLCHSLAQYWSAADRLKVTCEYCKLAGVHSAQPKQVRTHLCNFLDQILPGLVTLKKLDLKFVESWAKLQLIPVPSEPLITGVRLREEIMRFNGGEAALESIVASIGHVRELLLELGLLELDNDAVERLGEQYRQHRLLDEMEL